MADKNFKVKSGLNIPITSAAILTTDSSGNISSTSALAIANGGTGQTTATNAINALLPIQNGSTVNYSIQSDGTNISWAKVYNQLIQNAGTSVTPRRNINIVGGTFADDAGTDTTTITFTDNVGVSKSGGDTITASSASVIPLIAKGAASQSADYFQIQNSGGTILAQLNASNQFNVNYGSVYSQGGFRGGVNNHIGFAGLSGFAYSPAYLAIGAQGAVNQTANLQEWRNSSGTVLSAVNALGQGVFTNTTPITASAVSQAITAVSFTSTTATYTFSATVQTISVGEYVTVFGITPSGYNGTYQVTAVATVSAGTSYSFTVANTTNATVTVGTGYFFPSASVSISTQNKAHTGLIIKAASGQTASTMEIQNSSGQPVTWWDSTGGMTASQAVVSTLYSGGFMNTGTLGYFNATTFSPSVRPIVVRGAASQSANLTEWQNSAGTVLASINASGNLMVQDLTVNGTTTTINSTTLTIDDKNIELASVSSPTDTTADGAGITIKGATDKTFNWVQSTAAFTSSEPISAPAFKSAGTAVSSNITLVSGYKYFVDTTAARTLTLPASPSVGDEIVIYDASNSALTNNITVASNSNKLQGSVQDLIIDSNAAVAYLAYTGSTYGWAVN